MVLYPMPTNQGHKLDTYFLPHSTFSLLVFLAHFAFSYAHVSILGINPINARTDISKYFGEDSTPGGIGFQFRTIKQYAKSQKECADSGGDPQTLDIAAGAGKGEDSIITTGNAVLAIFILDALLDFACSVPFSTTHQHIDLDIAIALYYPDGSKDSLQHRFRTIVADGRRLREEGCEASAVRVFVDISPYYLQHTCLLASNLL